MGTDGKRCQEGGREGMQAGGCEGVQGEHGPHSWAQGCKGHEEKCPPPTCYHTHKLQKAAGSQNPLRTVRVSLTQESGRVQSRMWVLGTEQESAEAQGKVWDHQARSSEFRSHLLG